MTARSVKKSNAQSLPENRYRLLRIANEQFGQSLNLLSGEDLKRAIQIAEQEYLIEKVVLSSNEASQINIELSDTESSISQLVNRYEKITDFDADLKSIDLSMTDLKTAVHQELHVQATLNSIIEKHKKINDSDVELYYWLNLHKFMQPEFRVARQILITINEELEENKRTQSWRRINQIAKRIKRNPIRFTEQATKFSECPTALQDGLIGKVKRGTLFPELDTALFKLKEGEVSPVLETELGFHLLKCENIESPTTLPLDQVREQLKEKLQEKHQNKIIRRWIKAQSQQ